MSADHDAHHAHPGRPAAYHGGASFDAQVGRDGFARRPGTISADVLDAWFDPSPRVVAAVAGDLAWLLRTAPHPSTERLANAIARARAVPPPSILPGAGSSGLIHRCLPHLVSARHRVLVLDPTYSEYPHLLRRLGCRVETLAPHDGPGFGTALAARARDADWVILVNPNNPSGTSIDAKELQEVLEGAPAGTRWWIDETYAEFVGPHVTVEAHAASRQDVIVCKSMSKAYALSGARVGYLCAHPAVLGPLRDRSPPWAVGLPAQVAASAALSDVPYYQARWAETGGLAAGLRRDLEGLGWTVTGAANFLLCRVDDAQPPAPAIMAAAAQQGLFLRSMDGTGRALDDRWLRVAVKDEATNRRMVSILGHVLGRTLAT